MTNFNSIGEVDREVRVADIVAFLKIEGKIINHSAKYGNKKALEIINSYKKFRVDSKNETVITRLEKAIEDWIGYNR